ncbi:hypothetical protein HOC96_02840 [archaeon]|jgi:hypothetical protein|nr:hypothetical protein [archaeon]
MAVKSRSFNFFLKFLLFIILTNLILVSFVFAEFPLKECVGRSNSGPVGDGDGWLCLKSVDGNEDEACVVNSNGGIVSGSNERSYIKTYDREIYTLMDKSEVRGDINGINDNEAEGAVRYMADYFFSGSDACTSKYTFPASKFNTAIASGDGRWEDHEHEALTEYIKGDVPLILKCGGGHKKNFVIQGSGASDLADGEYDTKTVFYCQGGKWYHGSDLHSDKFDKDGDGVPSFSSDWSWDCDDSNPNVYGDVSIFSFSGDDPAVGAEICDDNVDNLCTGGDSTFYRGEYLNTYYEGWVTEKTDDPWTSSTDSCDNNPTACEEQCLFKDNKCTYLNYIGSTSDPGVTTTIGAGYCCGNDLNTDLGDRPDDNQAEICLNSDFITPTTDACTGGWCWVNSETNPFEIMTVKYLSEEDQTSFDVVSDSKEWQICKESEYALDGSDYGDTDANRFICYEEGDHYSFVECSDADTAETHNANPEAGTFSVKHRNSATGAFGLPLIQDTGNENRYFTDLTESGDYVASYEEIYTIGYDSSSLISQTIDFTGYDYLEFFVKYTGEVITLPELIQLTIRGLPESYTINEDGTTSTETDSVTYFDQNVLGYAVNEPLIKFNHNIHLRVPVGDWPDIETIEIQSHNSENPIEVLSMYLTKEDDIINDEVLICSGEDDTDESSWLTDLDKSDNTDIGGQSICQKRYGDNAWLGEDYTDEVANEGAPCCGDDANEFYDEYSLNDHACFNARPLENGETAMQVEFSVTYSETPSEFNEESSLLDQEFSLDIDGIGAIPIVGFEWDCDEQTYTGMTDFLTDACPDGGPELTGDCSDDDLNAGESSLACTSGNEGAGYQVENCEYTDSDGADQSDNCLLYDENYEIDCESTTNPTQVCNEQYNVGDCGAYTSWNYNLEVTCDQNSDYGHLPYRTAVDLDDISEGELVYNEEDSSYYISSGGTAELQGTLTVNYDESPKILSVQEVNLDEVLSYPDNTELELSVIQNAPTHNSNVDVYIFTPHDQRKYSSGEITLSYDSGLPTEFIYYVVAETSLIETTIAEDITVTPTEPFSYTCLSEECIYALPGNAPYKITNEHQELYDMYFVHENGIDETLITTTNQAFDEIGVLRVKSIAQQILFDYDQDDEEGGFYGCQAADLVDTELLQQNFDHCTVQGDYYCAHQDSKRLVNSWSQDTITQIGYEPVDEFDEDTELTLQAASYSATERNHSTASVPQRNIIPNADFSHNSGNDVLFWQLLNSASTTYDNEQGQVEDTGFEISTSYTLKSDKIAIKKYETYSYSDSSEECTTSLYLVNKDGDSEYVTVPEYFESLDNSYLIIEVSGSCDYFEPMLQRVDDLGPNDFEYNLDFPERQGAACCPEGMCHNGYVCVNNMAEYTYMTEEPQENMTYRCIDGAWSYLEPQYDWNGEEFGFCEAEEQCFVTSTLSEGAEYGATTEDFYNGVYPYCINDGEYLLDHYCESGEWSSRTKFLATKLLEFAETDEFVLYCAPFDQALPDYDVDGYNYQNYLGGEVSTTETTTDSLGAELSGESSSGSTIEVCYDALENSETGRRLVAQEENTCVNAVCVLQYKSGDGFSAAFATSMNHNITSDESFLIPLGVSQGELDTYCTSETETDDYIQCDDALWYSEGINSVIYAKDGISFDPSVIDTIVDWFLGIFGTDVIEDSENFIQEAQNFNTLYLLSKEGVTIRAVQEVEPERETLVAEFEGFSTPVCDYINNVDEEFVRVDQWPAEPEYLVDCELTEAGVYRVMTATNTDYWWPQLTSKIRVTDQ